MRDAKPEIEAKGGKLVVIGNGLPMHAAAFSEDKGLEGAVFTDPDRNLYRALGMTRGVGATFSASSLKNGLRAIKGGFRQAKTQGDPWQQGGTLVVAPDGRLLYEHISEAAGDHAPIEDVLAALDRA